MWACVQVTPSVLPDCTSTRHSQYRTRRVRSPWHAVVHCEPSASTQHCMKEGMAAVTSVWLYNHTTHRRAHLALFSQYWPISFLSILCVEDTGHYEEIHMYTTCTCMYTLCILYPQTLHKQLYASGWRFTIIIIFIIHVILYYMSSVVTLCINKVTVKQGTLEDEAQFKDMDSSAWYSALDMLCWL